MFAYRSQVFPANLPLKLTFYYRTRRSPSVTLQLRPQDGNYLTLGDLSPSDGWIPKEFTFTAPEETNQNALRCKQKVEADDLGITPDMLFGCMGMQFVVKGDGALWLDDIRVIPASSE